MDRATMRRSRPLSWLLGLAVGLSPTAAWALHRAVHARTAAYDGAPVTIRYASARLVRTYGNPSQFPLAALSGQPNAEVRVARSRVRYVNRLNQQIPTFLLEGELDLQNNSRKPVAALRITTVFLNAFQERIDIDQRMLTEALAPGQHKRIGWTRHLPHEEVFEVVVVVTAVRYGDGTVWAPTEELLLVP